MGTTQGKGRAAERAAARPMVWGQRRQALRGCGFWGDGWVKVKTTGTGWVTCTMPLADVL